MKELKDLKVSDNVAIISDNWMMTNHVYNKAEVVKALKNYITVKKNNKEFIYNKQTGYLKGSKSYDSINYIEPWDDGRHLKRWHKSNLTIRTINLKSSVLLKLRVWNVESKTLEQQEEIYKKLKDIDEIIIPQQSSENKPE